jgi:N-acetylmuramoyl-L-alanine amidase
MKKIYVSPSDQVGNKYAYGNTNEAAVCREIAKKLCASLERCGFEAKTDYADGADAMYNRCRQSDAWGADLHIAIHTNAFNGQVTGTRIFSYNYTGESYKACKCVFDALAPVTIGTSENITARSELYEIRVPRAVSVYVEVDFHDVPKIAKWLIENTEATAEAICKGVCDYYGEKYVEPKQTLYRVQVGAFSVYANAEAYMQKLKNDGYDAFIVEVNQ